ncbi:MAG: ComF family protein, partial [Patescibacteria group bacterium]
FKFFIDTIFPIECLGCGSSGKWICADCQKQIPINATNHCLACKRQTNYGEFCRECKNKYSLDGVLIASDYNNKLVEQAIKVLKFRFAYDIGEELARLLILFIEREQKQMKSALVMPVPLYPRRARWRGFNQSEILARFVAEHFNLPVDIDNLRRLRATRDQASLGEAERKSNVAGSFSWQGEKLSGRNIILVDDVVTTGATLEACAQALKQAGAKQVWGLVVAKG